MFYGPYPSIRSLLMVINN